MSTSAVAPNFPASMPIPVSTVRIVSICPFELKKEMSLGHCQYLFKIPPQPRGKYHILEVADTFTLIRMDFQSLSDTNPDPPLGPAPVKAMILANSLVSEWSRKIAQQGETGVRVMPHNMVEGSDEFKAFLASMTAGVRSLAEWAIRAAGDMYGQNKSQFISDAFHRTLALWLMGEDGARAIPWYNAQAVNELKKCLKCSNSINATARGCTHCGVDLIEYFVKYAFSEADDPFIAAIVKKIKMPAPTEGTTTQAGERLSFNVTIPADRLPSDVRASCVAALSGEQKAEMNTKKGQEGRDEYIISIIPDLCLKNAGLRDILKAKGHVIVNEA